MNTAIIDTAPTFITRSDTCFHCGDALSASAPDILIGQQRQRACCSGCAAAAQWIRDEGLGDYYRLRESEGNRVDTTASDFTAWDRNDVQAMHCHDGPQGREITFAVEGLRCAACAWLIDRALSRQPGVASVSVNALTGRLRLLWNPDQSTLSRLLKVLATLGYRPHLLGDAKAESERRRERNRWLLRLGLAALAATQAMMFSEALYFDRAHEMSLATRDFFRWLTFLLCTPVVFFSGWPFFAGMARDLRNRSLGMESLAATGIAAAYIASVIETVRGGEQVWFDAAAMFVLFLLSARMLEQFARQRASAQLDLLARAQPALAWRWRDGARQQIPVSELSSGDVVEVMADQTVPADGTLLDAEASFDESLLTGESTPVRRQSGAAVYAGSACIVQSARIQVTGVGKQTRLSQIQRLVEHAQAQKPRLARVADRIAAHFIWIMLSLSLLSFLLWSRTDPAQAFTIALSVLVAACPCALSLAVPAALSSAHDALARQGILVLHADALERLTKVDLVMFDKTGTLTSAHPTLSRVDVYNGIDETTALTLAAALERGSLHPLASAFAHIDAMPADNVQLFPGQGLRGVIGQQVWQLGRADFVGQQSDDSALWLGTPEQLYARFELAQSLRPEAQTTIAELKALHLNVAVLSGDADNAVREVCQTLAISDFRSRQNPEQKLAQLRQRQALGQQILMVGDGLNDAPVLAGADVSVALGSGSALSQRNADIVLLDGSLQRLPHALQLARKAQRIMLQNLVWAVVYNLLAVSLALTGHWPPGLAALGMACSSLLVTCNALRLARHDAL